MIAAVILAAGTSSRLGRPKQLLPLSDQPVIAHVADLALRSAVDQVLVVVGHQADALRTALGERAVEIVTNPDYATGQASSLVAGVRALGPEVEAMVVVLGDQPELPPETIDRLIDAWRTEPTAILQTRYGSECSHPILIAREVFPELLAITGDQGGREVIRRDPSRLRAVDSGESAPPADIDTEEAYRSLLERWNDRP